MLARYKAEPLPQAPWGLRWLDRLTEPGNPWLARGLLVTTLGLWVCSLFNIVWLGAAAGCWIMWMNTNESLQKHRREQRLATWRAQMTRLEQDMQRAWNVARLERAITPEWML